MKGTSLSVPRSSLFLNTNRGTQSETAQPVLDRESRAAQRELDRENGTAQRVWGGSERVDKGATKSLRTGDRVLAPSLVCQIVRVREGEGV